jgi:NADH:ubiquinone oxidoreductase subunit D
MSETHVYRQVTILTDRPKAVGDDEWRGLRDVGEKMFDVEIPKRAQYIRVILWSSAALPITRCIGTNLVDLGAISNFWYGFRPREEIRSDRVRCAGA